LSEIAILQQLSDPEHNSVVRNSTSPDPPPALEDAEKKFGAFLASQGYPKTIRWLSPRELLIDTKRHYWIRPRSTTSHRAAQRYAEGLKRNLGIELRAICATDTETFAHVFVPRDDLDRQYHLMGRVLKLSCPVERRPASTTGNLLNWFALRLLNGKQSNILGLFE
jgi:hypothetical protein